LTDAKHDWLCILSIQGTVKDFPGHPHITVDITLFSLLFSGTMFSAILRQLFSASLAFSSIVLPFYSFHSILLPVALGYWTAGIASIVELD
jgi:hypothetical protein